MRVFLVGTTKFIEPTKNSITKPMMMKVFI
jgi:hypothetical protein